MKRHREHLDMLLFKKVVDEFVALGGFDISFTPVIGDPLLDPYLLERVRYVKQFPQIKSLGFVTNLQWLHRFDMEEFFNAGIDWLVVSTTLSGPEKYFEFFGVDRYEQTIKNLIKLVEENEKRGNRIRITISLNRTDEKNNEIVTHPDYKRVKSFAEKGVITMPKTGLCVDDWLGYVQLPAYLKRRPLYPRLFRPCWLLYAGLVVFCNGKIGVCACRDFEANSELILGDIKSTTLREVWEGEKLANIRSNWRNKNKIPNICKRCSYYVY